MIKLLIFLHLFSFSPYSFFHNYIKEIKKTKQLQEINYNFSKPLPIIITEEWKQSIINYICTKNWDCSTAVAVAYAESGLNPNSISKTNDHGIFQINSYYQRSRIKGRNLYNYKDNIDIAYEIYKEQGFNPWYAYKNNKHLRYMNITGSGSLIK